MTLQLLLPHRYKRIGWIIAFSKEKDEDERIAAIRLESLLWAVLINSILLILAIPLHSQVQPETVLR